MSKQQCPCWPEEKVSKQQCPCWPEEQKKQHFTLVKCPWTIAPYREKSCLWPFSSSWPCIRGWVGKPVSMLGTSAILVTTITANWLLSLPCAQNVEGHILHCRSHRSPCWGNALGSSLPPRFDLRKPSWYEHWAKQSTGSTPTTCSLGPKTVQAAVI